MVHTVIPYVYVREGAIGVLRKITDLQCNVGRFLGGLKNLSIDRSYKPKSTNWIGFGAMWVQI